MTPSTDSASLARARSRTSPQHLAAQKTRIRGFEPHNYPALTLEDPDEIVQLRADLITVYQPVNSQELQALERVALAQQSMLRGARMEGGLLTACLNRGCAENTEPQHIGYNRVVRRGCDITAAQIRNYSLAEGFNRMADTGQTWTMILRYQAHAERLYRRAVQDFDRLKSLRPPGAQPMKVSPIPGEPPADQPDSQKEPQPEPAPQPSSTVACALENAAAAPGSGPVTGEPRPDNASEPFRKIDPPPMIPAPASGIANSPEPSDAPQSDRPALSHVSEYQAGSPLAEIEATRLELSHLPILDVAKPVAGTEAGNLQVPSEDNSPDPDFQPVTPLITTVLATPSATPPPPRVSSPNSPRLEEDSPP